MKRSLIAVGALALVALTALTGCSSLSSAETHEITPAVVRYPGPNPGFMNIDPQWLYIDGDRQQELLTCNDPGPFEATVCTSADGSVIWEPKKTKYSRHGYLTIDAGERTRFACTQRFEGFEEFDPTHFCYDR